MRTLNWRKELQVSTEVQLPETEKLDWATLEIPAIWTVVFSAWVILGSWQNISLMSDLSRISMNRILSAQVADWCKHMLNFSMKCGTVMTLWQGQRCSSASLENTLNSSKVTVNMILKNVLTQSLIYYVRIYTENRKSPMLRWPMLKVKQMRKLA